MAATIGELARYEQAMASPVGALGLTLRDLIWSAERLRARIGRVPDRVVDVKLSSAASLAHADLEENRRALRHLEEKWWAVADSEGCTARHPWRIVVRGDLVVEQQDEVVAATRRWLAALDALAAAARELPVDTGAMSVQALEALGRGLTRLPTIATAPPEVVTAVRTRGVAESVERLCADLTAVRAATAEIERWAARSRRPSRDGTPAAPSSGENSRAEPGGNVR